MKDKKQSRGPYGEKMIKLSIRFFANDMPEGTNLKTGWVKGVVQVEKNVFRGIEKKRGFFHNLEEVFPKVQAMLDEQGIKLVDRPTEKVIPKRLI